jgi:trimethylamine--corrinoid protein Co-methyltransferase
MQSFYCEALSAEDLQIIHETSLRILAEVGVSFQHEETRAIFQKHGCPTDGTRVFFQEDQVMDALDLVPDQFTIRARNPEHDLTIGDGKPVFAPGYGAPFLVDPEEGKRVPTLEDYQNLVKLSHLLPNQDMTGHLLVEPGDIDSDVAHLHMVQAHMLYSDKAFIGSGEGKTGAQHTLEMARILFGGDLKEYVTLGLISALSPLSYAGDMLEAVLAYARANQPLMFANLVMAGSTGPISLPGVIAQQNAELLAGIVLAQLVQPGLPILYGTTSTNIDMRTGALTIGSPELSLCLLAHAQLARYYGLPSRGGGALTDASLVDTQAGYESMMGLLTAVNSGVDFVLHAGGILSSYLAFSYEKLIVDDEMCGMVRRYQRGLEVNPDSLAYDVIADVGPGGHFLNQKHTLHRCRTEFWQPDLTDRSGLEAWWSGDRQTTLSRAQTRWKNLLERYQRPELEMTIQNQLQRYVKSHS